MSEQLIPTPGVFGENGNFLLERELGAGGMGGVYMGRDKMLDRPVAVKVMLKEYGADAEFVEKFKKEAQAAARLIHPNIAQIYAYGICDGMPYISMELVAGGSLYAIMQNAHGATDVPRVMKICQQVAQALQCASDQGFVHGDVKPENILLDANGNAKLVDFGLAAMQKNTDEIWGTPYYISPEKVRKEPVDFRADMYSLGGTLYHALTGVAPFEGDDAIAVVKKRFEGAPRKPSEIRPELTPAIDTLVMKMLALNRDDRYPSFEALLEAFKEVLTNGLTAEPPKTSAAAKPTGTGARRMMVTGRTRRVTSLHRRPSAATAAKPANGEKNAPETADADGDVPPTDPDAPKAEGADDEEAEEGGNLGLRITLFIVGGILALAAVVGGLIWFKMANEKSEKAAMAAQVASQHAKALAAVDETVKKAVQFADEFDVFAQTAVAECEKPTAELGKMLPAEIFLQLKPASSKELDDAIAATNPPPAVAAAPAAPTNTVAATAGGTNAPPAAAAKPAATNAAPAAAKAPPAKPAAPPQKTAPPAAAPATSNAAPSTAATEVVGKMHELWERAYGCLAASIRIRQAANRIVERGKEAEKFREVSLENANKLAELSRDLVELLDQMKTGKDVENVKKGIPVIKAKGKTTVEQTVKRLRIEKLERDRAEKAAAAEEAEKKRLEEQAAEKKALVEKESAEASAKFDAIAAQGSFAQLDWKGAIRQIEMMKSDFKTAEGELAADLQLRKVNAMKATHDVFIKHLYVRGTGYAFRKGKLKGAKVTGVNEREIQLVKADGKSKMKITWSRFYREFYPNLLEILNQFAYNGRKNAGLGQREVAEALTGGALTLQLVCASEATASERAAQLAQQAVKLFPEYAKTAKEIFPDITFAEAPEE